MLLVVLAVSSCRPTSSRPDEDSTAAPVESTEPAAAAEQTPKAAQPAEPAPETVATSGDQKVNAHAQLLLDFKERVDKYVSVRKTADNDTPPLKKTEDAAKIREAQDSLAQRIRAINVNAKHGDVFTPEISAYFKRLARPEVTDKSTKEAINEEAPDSIPYLKVNAIYPEKEPLSTVPANVLMALPMLPEDIEYRFVGKHMILRDSRANLIIDYVPNLMP
jgi:hypothetical protein